MIDAVIKAKAALAEEERSLESVFARIDQLSREVEDLKSMVGRELAAPRAALIDAEKLQARHLSPWRYSGIRIEGTDLYHHRYQMTPNGEFGNTWCEDKAWLRFMHDGEEWHPYLRVVGDGNSASSTEVLLPEDVDRKQLFALADKILQERGWILSEKPAMEGPREGEVHQPEV